MPRTCVVCNLTCKVNTWELFEKPKHKTLLFKIEIKGIRFSVNLEEIEDLNYLPKLLDITKNNKSMEIKKIDPNRANNDYENINYS